MQIALKSGSGEFSFRLVFFITLTYPRPLRLSFQLGFAVCDLHRTRATISSALAICGQLSSTLHLFQRSSLFALVGQETSILNVSWGLRQLLSIQILGEALTKGQSRLCARCL